MRTKYCLFIVLLLASSMSTFAQKATMYMPYQYAMEVDTSIWAVPYLAPQSADYKEHLYTELYFKPAHSVLYFKIHELKSAISDSLALMAEIDVKQHNGYFTSKAFKPFQSGSLISEIHSKNEVPYLVRGYRLIDPQTLVTYHYMPFGDTSICEHHCQEISEVFASFRLVKPALIDKQSGLPHVIITTPTNLRLSISKVLESRMHLHNYHNRFYALENESYWGKIDNSLPITDTLRFDQNCLNQRCPLFSFERVAQEKKALRDLTMSDEQAIEAFLNAKTTVHYAYHNLASNKAKALIEKKLSPLVGETIEIFSEVYLLQHTQDLCYLKAYGRTTSYLIVATRKKNTWKFKHTKMSSLSDNQLTAKIRTGFNARDNNQTPQRGFEMKWPSISTEGSFAFGFVPNYISAGNVNKIGLPKRFVVATTARIPSPQFLPQPNTVGYEVTYEILSPIQNVSKFMSHPFEAQTKIGEKTWMYSIYYRDEEKLKAGMLNSYQKLGVDDPTKRRYISPIYTTDYDRNGWDEIWYVTISNGLVLEVLGLERCKEGWTALRLNDVFLSKINLEQSVRDLLEISTSKQDPFQRALSSPLSNELELWNSRGGSGNQGYDRIHFDSIESIDMDMSQDADMGTTAPEATQRVEDGFQEEAVYSFASVMPVYPGGGEQMHTDISMNLIYPEDAKADGVGGKVFLQFIVEKDGSISNIKTARGINGYPEMAQAAEQAVRKLKKFSPAEQNGKPVRLTMTVPITFKLQ